MRLSTTSATILIVAEDLRVRRAMWTTLFAALSAHDGMVGVSGALRILAGALMKIGNDVRWFACDPRGGFGAAGGHILSTASVTMAITAQLVPRAKSPKQ